MLEFILRLKPRTWYLLIALGCTALLAFGLYLQHVVGIEPCPMCIVQRYAFIAITLLAFLAAGLRGPAAHRGLAPLVLLLALFGAFVAARQSWLQWYPPEVATCGRDFYGMVANFPLQRAIPMIFKGSGDCSAVDWTFLGGSIANWSFLCFSGLAVIAIRIFRNRAR